MLQASSTLDSPFPSLCSRFTLSADRVTESEWGAMLDQFADASFYQTWAYGAVSWGQKQLSHLILQHEGQPVALAQCRVVQMPLVRRGVAYVRWGPVSIRRDRAWDAAVYEAISQALVEE